MRGEKRPKRAVLKMRGFLRPRAPRLLRTAGINPARDLGDLSISEKWRPVAGHWPVGPRVWIEERAHALQGQNDIGLSRIADDQNRRRWIYPRDISFSKLLVRQIRPKRAMRRPSYPGRLFVLCKNRIDRVFDVREAR